MKTFEEIKQEIIETAKNNNACNEGINDALNSKSFPELLDVIVKYISWLCNTKTITGEWLENNFSELLESRNIYVRGFHSVSDKICYALDNSTVEAWGNSTVKAWGNSTVKAWGNSTVKAWGNSTVEAWGNSTVKAWGNSTVKAWDNSTVEAWGNSTVKAWGNSTVEALDNSTVEACGNSTVKAWGNSTVEAWGNSTVEAWGNSYCEFFNSKENHSVNESAILKDYYNKTIYIKKDNFKIIKL